MALNKWIGMGRITAPIELKSTQSGKSVASFTMAVDRDFKGPNGEVQTDFLNVVVWGKTAEFVSRYFGKGNLILVEGSVQVRSYTAQDGTKRYATEIIADGVRFTGEKRETATQPQNNGVTAAAPTFQEVGADDDLPF